MTPEDKRERAHEAERILQSRLWNEAVYTIRENAITSLVEGQGDKETHVATLRVIENLSDHLKSVVTTGKIEAMKRA